MLDILSFIGLLIVTQYLFYLLLTTDFYPELREQSGEEID